MAKNIPSAATIAQRTAGGPHFAGTFQAHMMLGDNVAGAGKHTGLHSLNIALGQYPKLTEVTRVATDSRVSQIYAADVRIKGGKDPKRSSFFPATMDFTAIQAAVIEAWRDFKIYSQSEVYKQLASKYALAGWARRR